ncbi:flagellar protein FlhE [Pseudomonas abietaniphila]|uniref:flagellar protein FlhE n=1 Tax=Pseudomonas abietaniphila TaxID=89065 RepID=UPI0009E5686F|nr:flagellar protein FlhE [Pseudomonas abietaniphila]
MKNYKKLNGALTAAVLASVVYLASPQAVAGSVSSVVNLPTIHSKNYAYKAHLPAMGLRSGQGINSVTWNWTVHGWPQGLEVHLCQGPTRCIDVSRQRTGSTSKFKNFQPFYYELKLSSPGNVPVAGLLGKLTVDW